ncbi:MAG TPA: hypothetical protein VH186_15975 [Chloroflexia bacterium]|nr:hypothetical protein [Chloroflexia bacterium]
MTESFNTDNTGQQDNPQRSLLTKIHKGMEVVDQNGEHIGKVTSVEMPDPGSATLETSVRPGDLLGGVMDAFTGSDNEILKTLHSDLIRTGYIKVNGQHLRNEQQYIVPDSIANVSGEKVTLNRTKEKLTGKR